MPDEAGLRVKFKLFTTLRLSIFATICNLSIHGFWLL
jgi:hypothetical protein